MTKKNIFIIGSNDFNNTELKTIENAESYNFIPIFEQEEVQKESAAQDVHVIMQKARQAIEDTEGSPDAIIGFFDFPVTLITFLLCQEYNLIGPPPRSGFMCEHKYWSRLEQNKIISENVPGFQAIDTNSPPAFDDLQLDTPFWVKPVKAFSAQLGFKIENADNYTESMKVMQAEIPKFAKPFNDLLNHIELPDEIEQIDGNYSIAEEIIGGHQCTVTGYVHNGDVVNYGVVDSINYENSPSFFYYMYPSNLDESVQKRLKNISEKVMRHMGFDNSPFNIEYFYDEESDDIKLLEINPRMSQSHSDLFAKVNGSSNHEILVQLALGIEPDFKKKSGMFHYAAKFQYRLFEDGVIESVPDHERIAKIEKQYPETHIHLDVIEGQRLSELEVQDRYSFCLGNILIGGESEADLLQKYDEIIKKLAIRVN